MSCFTDLTHKHYTIETTMGHDNCKNMDDAQYADFSHLIWSKAAGYLSEAMLVFDINLKLFVLSQVGFIFRVSKL